jgi:preprotein translocase subunit SecA
MDKLKMPEGEPIEAGMVSRAIESAQRKVEGRNFDMRKQLLEYDDVSNEQRKAIYGQRNEILESEDVSDTINAMRDSAIGDLFDQYIPPNSMDELWNAEGLEAELAEMHIGVNIVEWVKNETTLTIEEMKTRVIAAAKAAYDGKVEQAGEPNFRNFERSVLLQHVDQQWRDHLAALDHLRQGIHLRGYAQKNPKQEYKREAFELFSSLLDNIKRNVLKIIMTVQIRGPEDVPEVIQHEVPESAMQFKHDDLEEILASGDEDKIREALMAAMQENSGVKVQFTGVARNDACPCGSGKKYKHCHGQLA